MRPLNDYTEAYAEPGKHWIVDVIDPDTGLTAICGETAEQIRERYPTAERVTLDAWTAARAAEQDTPITWSRTTKAKYWEMLEILPPALWIGGAFLVGEPCDHHARSGQPRFQAYWQLGSSEDFAVYLVASRPMTGSELRAILKGER